MTRLEESGSLIGRLRVACTWARRPGYGLPVGGRTDPQIPSLDRPQFGGGGHRSWGRSDCL
jgi:hypothetical protein